MCSPLSTVHGPRVQSAMLMELPWWKLTDRLAKQEDLPGLPSKGETINCQDDLTWCIFGYEPRNGSYPEQEFNGPDEPFFPMEMMELAKKCRDTLGQALPRPS